MKTDDQTSIVSEGKENTEFATTSEHRREMFVGIDTAKVKQVVTCLIPGEGPKPAEGMGTEGLLARIARWRAEPRP